MDAIKDYKELKLQLEGLVPQGHGFHRNLLFDAVYASLPRDPQVKVQIYNAEIVPGGYTNWHCHNGAAFFVALQGLFEAHFQEGVLVKAKSGDCYSEPIAKFHRGHNPHPELAYLCVGLCFTSPDREHVTNSVERPWWFLGSRTPSPKSASNAAHQRPVRFVAPITQVSCNAAARHCAHAGNAIIAAM